MRFLPTRVHGLLDYLVGLLLIASPWIFGFVRNGAETTVPVALGIAAIVYSFFTAYEWGLVKRISMRFHLGLDFASGVLLAASPWIFGFADYVWLPHLLLGILEMLASSVTKTVPGYKTTITTAESV